MFMTLNRRYEAKTEYANGMIKDLTTYIDPRRKISAKQIPNL